MQIYAIGDLHLSGSNPKPMNIFGAHWDDHWEKIKKEWISVVQDEDVVLIPGDISWAMNLDEAAVDLENIGVLPGKKIIIRGNHDYWWSSVSKIRQMLPPSMQAIQNDSITVDGYTFCGTRGWAHPGSKEFGAHDLKIYQREVQRLKLSLEHTQNVQKLIVMLHYPPFDDKGRETQMVEMIRNYQPAHVIFGHLHGEGIKNVYEGLYQDTMYHLVSCDYLGFKLKHINGCNV